MRAIEILSELVTRAETTDHLLNRAATAAKLCEEIGDRPLLFREFKTGLKRETVLAKVINRTEKEGARKAQYVKGGVGREGQIAILEKLGLENPVFTKMTPPTETFGFHGDPHIFIPPPGARVMWSPKVIDLGGQRVIGKSGDEEPGKTPDGATVVGRLAKQADYWAATYQESWPEEYTQNEIIFDCDYYYLLNIESLIKKFSGKEMKDLIANNHPIWKKIDPSVWEQKLKTYSNVAWYLQNPFVSFVKWYQENVENPTPERQAERQRKEQERLAATKTYMIKPKDHNTTIMSSGVDEEDAIRTVLKSRSGQYFPNGKDSIESIKKL